MRKLLSLMLLLLSLGVHAVTGDSIRVRLMEFSYTDWERGTEWLDGVRWKIMFYCPLDSIEFLEQHSQFIIEPARSSVSHHRLRPH